MGREISMRPHAMWAVLVLLALSTYALPRDNAEVTEDMFSLAETREGSKVKEISPMMNWEKNHATKMNSHTASANQGSRNTHASSSHANDYSHNYNPGSPQKDATSKPTQHKHLQRKDLHHQA